MADQSTRIDAMNADHAMARQPVLKTLLRAPIAGLGCHLTRDQPFGMGLVSFLIVRIDTGVAQLGVGESDQLPRITGIGHHLLISGHSRVENNLTHHAASGSTRQARKHRSVGEHQQRRLPGCSSSHEQTGPFSNARVLILPRRGSGPCSNAEGDPRPSHLAAPTAPAELRL